MRKAIATVAAIVLVAVSLTGCVRAEASASPDYLAAMAGGDSVTMQPTDTSAPTETPTATATETPTLAPTAAPTVRPTVRPTVHPAPTVAPVVAPAPPVSGPTMALSEPTPPGWIPSPPPGATPTPVPTPRPVRTGTLGNWTGYGPTVITVTGTMWIYGELSWSCATPGIFAMDPLVSSNSQQGSLEGVLGHPDPNLPPGYFGGPTIGPVTITGDGGCAWKLSIW